MSQVTKSLEKKTPVFDYEKEPLASQDWRKHGVLNPVQNQDKCNCCCALVACEAVSSIHKICHPHESLFQLSAQNLIDCKEPKPTDPKSYDEAGCYTSTINRGFRYIEEEGAAYEEDYPFTKGRGDCIRLDKSFKFKGLVKIDGFAKLSEKNLEDTLRRVVTHHPIGACMTITEKLMDLQEGEIYRGGEPLLQKDPRTGETVAMEPKHAVLIVGFDHDDNENVDYWIIKNTWGVEWAGNGYGKVCSQKSLESEHSLFSRVSYPRGVIKNEDY